MHIHKDSLNKHRRLLIIDDLLATGGTALAAVRLIEKFSDKKIVGAGFIIDLPDLGGSKKLEEKAIAIQTVEGLIVVEQMLLFEDGRSKAVETSSI